jgi:hypothetical protein
VGKLQKLRDEEYFSDSLLLLTVNIMVYCKNVDMGVVTSYKFLHGNTGVYRSRKVSYPFFPNQYSSFHAAAVISETAMIMWILGITILLISYIFIYFGRIRNLFNYRLNSFTLTDFMTLLQLILASLIIYDFFYLFFSVDYMGENLQG